MTIKQTLIALTIVLTSATANGQVKDYYLPIAPNNMAKFYEPTNTGGRTEFTRAIFYINNGNTYEIKDVHLYNGEILSATKETVQFSENEVKLLQSVSASIISNQEKSDFNPPKIIFKMPPTGQTVSWAYTEASGDHIKCTASWTTINFNGEQRTAIKVVKQIEEAPPTLKLIEYYVKGVGLWQTETQDGNVSVISDKFDRFN